MLLGKVEKLLRKTKAGKELLTELKGAVRAGTKKVDRAVRDATNYINQQVGPSTTLRPGQQQVKPATKAQDVTKNVARTKYRQGLTAGATTAGVTTAVVSDIRNDNEKFSPAEKSMIAEYRMALEKGPNPPSDKDIAKKVEAFERNFIKKGKPDVEFNKGGAVKKKKPVKKLAKGGFPDLTGDGKVTKADVLKGRGVAMNMGGMKKQYGSKNFMSGGYVMGKKKK